MTKYKESDSYHPATKLSFIYRLTWRLKARVSWAFERERERDREKETKTGGGGGGGGREGENYHGKEKKRSTCPRQQLTILPESQESIGTKHNHGEDHIQRQRSLFWESSPREK